VKRVFTEPEAAYLRRHSFGHLATASAECEPHVVPLRYRFNEELETIDLGGHGDPRKKKYYRNLARTGRAAFVVDDLVAPGHVRAVQVRGTVELLPAGGETVRPDFDPPLVRLTPYYVVSWGLESSDPFVRKGRPVG